MGEIRFYKNAEEAMKTATLAWGAPGLHHSRFAFWSPIEYKIICFNCIKHINWSLYTGFTTPNFINQTLYDFQTSHVASFAQVFQGSRSRIEDQERFNSVWTSVIDTDMWPCLHIHIQFDARMWDILPHHQLDECFLECPTTVYHLQCSHAAGVTRSTSRRWGSLSPIVGRAGIQRNPKMQRTKRTRRRKRRRRRNPKVQNEPPRHVKLIQTDTNVLARARKLSRCQNGNSSQRLQAVSREVSLL